MKGIRFLQFILATLIVLALSCARITAPTGGPKDSIPPVVTRMMPAHQQTNFAGQEIELTFDESIILNNVKDQIIITPGVGKDFEVIAKKNKVVLTLDNPLQPNTTYTINFRDAVQDITEKNPARNLYIAFSTGTYIDSLHVHGNVYELLTAKPGKDATVALYEQDTFDIFRHKPAYFTKADQKGNFHIDNLKPGAYYLYSWLDNNKNLIVDSKTELYGFLADPIHPDSTNESASVPLVRLDARQLRLTSARPSQTFFNIKASKSIDHYRIQPVTNHEIHSSFGDDHENIRIYNTFNLEPSDSIPFNLYLRDSLSQTIDTLLYIKFAQRNVKPAAFQFTQESFAVSATTGKLEGTLLFNKPVVALNLDSIYYYIDSLHQIPFTPQDLDFDSTHTLLKISKQLERSLVQPADNPETQRRPAASGATKSAGKTKPARNNYDFILGRAAFFGPESDSSKAATIALKPLTMENTGVIMLAIRTTKKNLIVELLSRDKVVKRQPATTKATFADLAPGDYTLRVFADENQDGRWSPGNFYLHEEPEPVYFYKNEEGNLTISLKANWERELTISF